MRWVNQDVILKLNQEDELFDRVRVYDNDKLVVFVLTKAKLKLGELLLNQLSLLELVQVKDAAQVIVVMDCNTSLVVQTAEGVDRAAVVLVDVLSLQVGF